MRARAILLLGALGVALAGGSIPLGAGLVPAHGTPATAEPARALDRRRAFYLEDGGTGRALATIDARLAARAGAARLEVTIAAVGSGIDPVPGFHGVAGENHITAREIGRLLHAGALALTTTDAAGRCSPGTVRAGRRGAIAERRYLPGRGFVFDARSADEYPLELILASGPCPPGEHETELRADGVPRLRIRFRFDGARGAITAVESLGVDLLR